MPTIYPNLTPDQRVKLLKYEVDKKFYAIKEEENITGKALEKYIDGI